MSTSTFAVGNIELLPTNFGLWSGPGWAGGWNLPPGSDSTGEIFRRLYGDVAIGGTKSGVLPRCSEIPKKAASKAATLN